MAHPRKHVSLDQPFPLLGFCKSASVHENFSASIITDSRSILEMLIHHTSFTMLPVGGVIMNC